MDLLAAEITARTGKDPGEHYRELAAEFGAPYYTRIDAPATPEQKAAAGEAVARGGPGVDARRRADHRQADPRPGQRRPDRRPEGRGPARLVRGPAVRHREHLQDLRGELPRPGAPGRHRGRGSRHRRPCAWGRRMSDRGRRAFLRFRRDTARPACCCTSRRCRRLRHRRSGAGRVRLGRPPPRGRAALVAGAAAGTDGVWRFAVSVPVVVRRQRAADQPGRPDRGRAVAGGRLRGPRILADRRRIREGRPVQAPPARDGVEPLQRRRPSGPPTRL